MYNLASLSPTEFSAARLFLFALALISYEESLQDWNYRLRKPCGNNFEAAKSEEN